MVEFGLWVAASAATLTLSPEGLEPLSTRGRPNVFPPWPIFSTLPHLPRPCRGIRRTCLRPPSESARHSHAPAAHHRHWSAPRSRKLAHLWLEVVPNRWLPCPSSAALPLLEIIWPGLVPAPETFRCGSMMARPRAYR